MIPQQRLLEVIRGAVYHDGDGELTRVRELLAWYPPDVHLWLLAAHWQRVQQEEAFIGRAAEVGDELGSRLAAARMVRELMRICFLLQRTYWPYTKWFGTAFARLEHRDELPAHLAAVLATDDYPTRERALVESYERVAARHNAAGMTAVVDPSTRPFYGRPFQVLMAPRFVDACLAALPDDSSLRALPLIGSIDQFVDSTDVLSALEVERRVRVIYEPT